MFAFFTAASTLDLPPAARAGRFSRPSGSGRSAARPAARGADDHPFQFASGSGGWLRRTPDPHTLDVRAFVPGSRRKILTFLGGGFHYSVSYPMVFQHSAGCPIARIHVYRRRFDSERRARDNA